MNNVRVGLGKSLLNGSWDDHEFSYHDDITARALYLEGEHHRLLWIVTDFSYLFRKQASTIRKRVAEKFGLDTADISVLAIESHASAVAGQIDEAIAAENCIPAVEEAISTATPGNIRFIAADVGSRFSVNRRQLINRELGVFTFWYGYRFEGGRAEARALARDAIRGLGSAQPVLVFSPPRERTETPAPREEEVPELAGPIWYDRPVDPLLQLAVFSTSEGKNVGSIIRFSAHPATVNRLDAYQWSADYPYFLRQRLEEELGGITIFLEGPSANLVAPVDKKSFELGRRIGEGLADEALKVLDSYSPPAQPLENLRGNSLHVHLPIRTEFPASVEEAKQRESELTVNLAALSSQKVPLGKIKKLGELREFYSYVPSMFKKWVSPTREEIQQHYLEVELSAWAVNDLYVIGLPGEIFMETGLWLRGNSQGVRLITASNCNGYTCYLPTPDEAMLGGYESCCAILSPEAEPLLRQAGLKLLKGMFAPSWRNVR